MTTSVNSSEHTEAESRPWAAPQRLAVVGKGGAGKSCFAGVYSRLLARRGRPVLLLDSDPMPGLAISLGVEPTDAGIPEEAVEEGPKGGPRYLLRAGWEPAQLVERAATHAPDGVRLLQVGKSAAGGLSQPALHAYQQLLDALVPGAAPSATPALDVQLGDSPRELAAWHVIGDLPGGTRQPFMGWGRFADTFLVVVEPSAKAVLAARRLAHLATGWSHGREFRVAAVANKVREASDVDWVADHTRLDVVASIPWDQDVAAAERAGRSPLDHAPDSEAVAAIENLVERLTNEREMS